MSYKVCMLKYNECQYKNSSKTKPENKKFLDETW